MSDFSHADWQAKARKLGLSLALITRILLLMSLTWIMGLTRPLFTVPLVNQEEGSAARDLEAPPVRKVHVVPATVAANEGRVKKGRVKFQKEKTHVEVSLSGISVLLVEDDVDARNLIHQLLELRGAKVTSAASAAAVRV